MILTFANFKGGIGKTTTTALFTYLLGRKGYKVLAVDTDPQCSLTGFLTRTYKQEELDNSKNIYNALFIDQEVKQHIEKLEENVFLLKGSWLMSNFEKKARELFYISRLEFILKDLLHSIKEEYDFILIDTLPSTSLIMDNIIMATEQVVIVTQTETMPYESTKSYYAYLLDRYEDPNYAFELMGVLPYLVGKASVDNKYLELYNNVFEEEVFNNYIRKSDRVKSWGEYGITDYQPYDRMNLEMYERVVSEALERMKNGVEDEA